MTFQSMLHEANHSIPMAVQLATTLAEHYDRFETQYRHEGINRKKNSVNTIKPEFQ